MKINQARHDEVVRLANAGLSTYAIAEYIGLTPGRVQAILKRNEVKTIGGQRYNQTSRLITTVRTDVLNRFHLAREIPTPQAVEEALELWTESKRTK